MPDKVNYSATPTDLTAEFDNDPTLTDPDAPASPDAGLTGFSDELQREVVAAVLQDSEVSAFAQGKITGKEFSSRAYQTAVSIALDYQERYGALIPRAILEAEFREQIKNRKAPEQIALKAQLGACYYYKDGASATQYYKDKVASIAQRYLLTKGFKEYAETWDHAKYYKLIEKAQATQATKKAFKLYDLDEVEQLGDLVWQIDEHIPKNGTITLFGSSGVGKSFLGLEMALCVATGLPYLGKWNAVKGNVLYLYSEGGYGCKGRARAWFDSKGIARPKNIVFSFTCHNLQDRAEADQLIKAATARVGKLDLVIVDTLSRNFGGGDTDHNSDMQAYLSNVDHIRETTGATVVNVHHTGWGQGDRERGAKSLRDYSDTSICVAKVKTDNSKIEVSCKKQKDDSEFEAYHLRKNESGKSLYLSLIGVAKEEKAKVAEQTHNEDEAAFLAAVPVASSYEEGITLAAVAEKLGWTKKKVDRISGGLMLNTSILRRDKEGKAANLPYYYFRPIVES